MKIVLYPHPALRHKCRPLSTIDRQLEAQVREMFDLMYAARGLGLAANQVALPYQLLVMNLTADPSQPDREEAYINPTIVERKGSQEGEEGCLSLPELYAKVRRAKNIKVHAYNMKGQSVEITASDLAARVWQHEVDHLHGELFIDKLGPIGKLNSRSSVKEFERSFRKAQERGDIPPNVELEKQLEALEALA